MTNRIALVPGDGITHELADPVVSIIEAAGADVEFVPALAGAEAFDKHGAALPDETVATIEECGIALKGKFMPSRDGTYESPSSALRRKLDLFATVRPLRNLAGLPSRHDDVDIVVIRESTEDIYAGLEHTIRPGIVASLKVVTDKACERITRYAFEYARRHKRRKVTLVHKANIMKVTDGMFIRTAERVAAEFDGIEFDKLIVDNACMQLLARPHRYDVILCGNLYGDIISDLGAGIIGGISATMGAVTNGEVAVFEALHGDAPKIVGKGVANPLPFLMPAAFMLEHLGMSVAAERIAAAVSETLVRGVTTPDLGGTATTQEMTDAIIAHL